MYTFHTRHQQAYNKLTSKISRKSQPQQRILIPTFSDKSRHRTNCPVIIIVNLFSSSAISANRESLLWRPNMAHTDQKHLVSLDLCHHFLISYSNATPVSFSILTHSFISTFPHFSFQDFPKHKHC